MRRALVFVPALVVLGVLAFVIWPVPLHVGDWFQFWYVGRVMASGASPLDAAAWQDAANKYPLYANDFVVNRFAGQAGLFATPETFGLYPPWLAVLFVPFGILPLEFGIRLLHVTLIVTGLAGMVWFVARWDAPDPTRALGLGIGVVLEPFVLASRTGHFTSFLFVGGLLVMASLGSGATAPMLVGAILLSLKPHLSLVFAPIVLAILVRRRAWRQIAIVTLTLLAIAAVFYLRYPPPIALAARAIWVQATTDDTGTTWSLAEAVAPGYGPALGALALALLAVLGWIAVRLAPPAVKNITLVAVSLGLSIAAAPYVHTYDQMLLVPALLLPLAITAHLPGPARLAIGTATIAGAVVYPWFAYFSDVNARQAPTGAVPYIAVALIAASVVVARRSATPRA